MTDAALPQLSTILDPEAMSPALARACLASGERWEPRDCRVGHVRYKPGKNCLVRYDMVWRDRIDGRETSQMWYGRAYEPGSSGSRWHKAAAAGGIDVETGPGLAHIEELGTVLWAFPNDRKLRGLQVLLDRRALGEEVLRLPVTATRLVHYVPEHGCTVRADAGGASFYVKVHSGETGEQACRHAQALGREAWFVPVHRASVQREIPGATPQVSRDLTACAQALARLHRERLTGLPAHTDPLAKRRLAYARSLLDGRDPALDQLIFEIQLRWAAPQTEATLHGDLHLKNFLVHDGRAELIDLDTLQTGDPLEDLGSFAASLYHRAVLEGGGTRQVEAAIGSFVRTYAALVPWRVDDRDLAVHIARALVTERACRSITRCKGDVVRPLLDTARRLLDDTLSARGRMHLFMSKCRDREGEVLDVHYKTFEKRKSWSKSTATVAWRTPENEVFVEQIGPASRTWGIKSDPVHPQVHGAADILTFRPGRRLTARYRVETAEGKIATIYGKTYADDRGRDVDARLKYLWDRGFPMPKPLGYSPESRTVWQEAFDGQPLAACLEDATLAAAAARLRFLHECGMPCPPRPTYAELYEDLKGKLAKVALMAPEQQGRLGSLLARLEQVMTRLPAAPLCVVHGDFHLRQFMVSDAGEVALFDFDEVGYGDPVEDLANFTADLYSYQWPDARVRNVAGVMISAYALECGWPIRAESLRWHTAMHLLTRPYRALLQLKPDFDERVARYIRLVEEELQ